MLIALFMTEMVILHKYVYLFMYLNESYIIPRKTVKHQQNKMCRECFTSTKTPTLY